MSKEKLQLCSRAPYLIFMLVLGSIALGVLVAYVVSKRRQSPPTPEDFGSQRDHLLDEDGLTETSKDQIRPTVRVWERLAEDAGIFPSRIKEVSQLLKGALEQTGVRIEPEDIPRLRNSLRRFIKIHKFILNGEKYRRGIVNWTVYCVIEALKRDMSDEPETEVLNHYWSVCDKLTKHIREQIWKKIPDAEQGKFRGLIESGLEQFNTELRKRTNLLHRDFLCPAFKRPMDEEDVKKLIASFSHESLYPALEEPRLPMITKEERFTQRLENFLKNSVSVALFTMFFDSNRDNFAYTDYLGHMKPGGWNTDRFWPACVHLTPNELKNELKDWKREKHED